MSKEEIKSVDRFKKSLTSVSTGLVCNVVLAVVKTVAGILGNSYALIADGIESIMDIISSMIVWGGIKIGSMPADDNHPYGHGKAESLAAMIVSVVLIGVGIEIAIESIKGIHSPHHTPAAFTLIVLIIVVLIKETLFRYIFSVGKDVNSISVKTDAWHHRSDALTSVAAFIGISISLMGGKGYESADNWAALVASAIIVFNGMNLFRHAVAEIMDASPGAKTEQSVREIASQVPGVIAIEKCRVRKSGQQIFVDIHVIVDANMTVRKAHDIGHDVKDALVASSLSIADVLVHIEPD